MTESLQKTIHIIDARGLKCPLPTLRVETEMFALKAGDIVEVIADCPTFEADVRALCAKRGLTLLLVTQEGAAKRIQVRV